MTQQTPAADTVLYGIPNCDTCRRARRWLRDQGVEFAFHDMRTDGITVAKLQSWCERLGYEKVLNRRSLTWRKVPEMDRQNLDQNAAIALMADKVTLVKRPVLEHGNVVAVGFSTEGYRQILKLK